MKTIAILTGGVSSEREVALWSSTNVFEALQDNYQVQVFDLPSELDEFLSHRKEFNLVVPVFHGPWGEDGVIQGFLEVLNIPFLFSGLEAHAIGMNKSLAKEVVACAGLNVASSTVFERGDNVQFDHPVVVKPIAGGSTIGISKAESASELTAALKTAFEHGDTVMVEDLILGREFTVGVIDENGESIALPVVEIISETGFFDYESKYHDNKLATEVCPAEIEGDLARELQEHAVKAHNAIGARHVSRIDFIVDDQNKIWFLEINTIPGMTKNSLIPKELRASGRTLGSVFENWIIGQGSTLQG